MAQICGYQCASCGAIQYPKPFVCKHCNGTRFTEAPLEGTGVLLTWTRVYSLPAGFSEPYRNFGMVRFENGVTVTGVLNFDALSVGMPVLSTVDVIRGTGADQQYGFVFCPLPEK